jgi:multiple sugar transport system permease protein
MSHADRLTPSRVMTLVLVGAGVVLLAAPLWFTFVFATHDRADIFANPPPLWFGTHFLANVALLLERLPFWRNLGMSLYVATMTTALNLVLCALAGYAFAVHEFAGKRILFALVVGSMPAASKVSISRS